VEERVSHLPTDRLPQRLMRIDVSSFVGAYPYRKVPGTSPEDLLRAMDRVGTDEAWVSHLPSVFWRNPAEGNPWLYQTTERQARFRAVPAVHPGLADWERTVAEASSVGVPAVRCDPMYYGLDPTGPELRALVQRCGQTQVPLLLAVRLEDARQRHPNDRAGELPPWAVRTLIRIDSRVRLLITHADRPFIEEVHFGSTPEESARIWWDIAWIWGPPEDHLETLLRTIGAERFVFGTGQPLRLPETSVAKLDLLDLSKEQRAAIENGNLKNVTPSAARGRSKAAAR
jgi:predicted TIM-barrel fold metal-dependent hydrolase